ncbi:hypothetical protein [Tardiphaga alba]|uniref:hypothetical protein n=1 Tax=Tardiphaga alba TaxID=340268 RepID=UPI001BA89B39|nr:hypothetical protein [Tardiphaga alba]
MTDEQRSREIREREARENQQAHAQAKATGKAVSFIASDGCEVTVTPAGHVFHNIDDWY